MQDYTQEQRQEMKNQWDAWWDSLTEQQRIDTFFLISDRLLSTVNRIEVVTDPADPAKTVYAKDLDKQNNENISFSFDNENKTLKVLVANHDIITFLE